METLSLIRLKALEAGDEALQSFERIFGEGTKIKDVVYRLQNPEPEDLYTNLYGEWEGWLLSEYKELTIAFGG